MTDYRILVTGAAGFLGKNLMKALRQRYGNEVDILGLDDYSTSSGDDLLTLEKIVRGDVNDVFMFSEKSFNEVWHLASPASPEAYLSEPMKTIWCNTVGLNNCLFWTKDHGSVFFASTSETYGDPLQHPQKESYHGNVNPVGPRACYDESKRLGETICSEVARHPTSHGFKTIRCARLFNAYGPGMLVGDGRLIPNLVRALRNGDSIEMHGDGSQTRSITYIEDVVNGIMKVMYDLECDQFEPVNIGSTQENTVAEIIDMFCKIAAEKGFETPRVVHGPMREDDPQKRRPDISMARERLGWGPNIGWELGLSKTNEHYMGISK